jgi:chemotaxis signal transduction protein
MFGEQETRAQRLVTIRVDGRVVALLVDAVLRVRAIPADSYDMLPPLLADSASEIVSAIGILDAELLLFLHAARMVPSTVLEGLDRDLSAA